MLVKSLVHLLYIHTSSLAMSVRGYIEHHISFSRQKIENILPFSFFVDGCYWINMRVIASKHFTEDDMQQVAKYNINPNKARIIIKLWYGMVETLFWISIWFYKVMKLASQTELVLFTRVFRVVAECRINSNDLVEFELQFLNFGHLAVSLSCSHLNGVQEWKMINITNRGHSHCG